MKNVINNGIINTRVSSLNACVEHAIKCGATKNRQAYFFQGWRGYIKNDKLKVTNFYEKELSWEFRIGEINESCLVFYKTNRCHLLSMYTSCLETLVPEITLGAELKISEYLSRITQNDVSVYYYTNIELDDFEAEKTVFIYRINDFPAMVEGNGFCINWEARGVLAKVSIIAGIDESPVIKQLKLAIRCWTAHLKIEAGIPF